ncbi:hypothetical protein CK203_065745 [Vitis vinifera]|uniref:Uncharacterized protein n=1 Tax=Vitis vinifera TaxID=29760 RepID=A0A438G3C8_VITVI|nr:hypothetical protein CK203_065745 [Vitis vinifera]
MKGEESSSKAEQGSKTKEAEHLISRCQNFAHLISRCENFAHPKPRCEILGPKEAIFAHPNQGAKSISRCEIRFQGANFLKSNFAHHCKPKGPRAPAEKLWNPEQSLPSFRPWRRPEEAFPPPHPHRHLDHIEPPWEPQLRHLFRPRPFPHLRGKLLLSADTPPGGHPRTLCHQSIRPRACFSAPAKRTKFSGPGEPSHLSQSHLQRNPDSWDILRDRYQASHDSRTTDRGQLGLQRSILPLETYFDIEALRQQPELRDSFRLLQRPPQSYSHPIYHRRTPGCHWSSHIAEALRIPYEPVFRQTSGSGPHSLRATWSAFCPGGLLQPRESPSEEASEGRWHPITISEAPLPDFRALGYPEEPRLERRRHCREDFSLDKWHHLAQQDEILTETTPPAPAAPPQCTCPRLYILPPYHSGCSTSHTEHCSGFYYPPDGHYSCTPGSDHCYSGPAYHDPSSDSAASEYADSSWHDRSAPSEPLVPDEESLPAEQPIPEEEIRAEPSHDPTHI